ncbi:3-oxoacyl-[acyl-carrier protein] reductase [Paracoccidioides lutzii Pb01]|uniref:3-oxoacyl-[acyl-carrier protein] reductase n=1 Tax=Paracoccidioides lutzii (strain ATCC MYA-826 / Pb01) TaxID=502779 RepID=C1H322_PARBA|nr:3-oxoacyl-[acyl-carrier protein] reductase [Paracoccidioides lutzii Pb01]EEH34116.2 3-oxoacyl-[acyl-carrier protein] reductase [Paracoccidioides lutzii Pb01]
MPLGLPQLRSGFQSRGLMVRCCPISTPWCSQLGSETINAKPEARARVISRDPWELECLRSFSTSHDATNKPRKPLESARHQSPPLKGLTCMVTGGSSGIGYAIARRFLREGAEKVILVGRSRRRLEEAVRRLEEEEDRGDYVEPGRPMGENNDDLPQGNGVDVHNPAQRATPPMQSIEFDNLVHDQPHDTVTVKDCEISEFGPRFTLAVGDVGNPSFWGEEIKKLMDNVDVLVNAAGISYSSLLPLTKEEHITAMLRTNLQGTIVACRTMSRRVMRANSLQKLMDDNNTITNSRFTKCIINISSLHAMKGGVGAATYASTKAGVVALTRAIAAESGEMKVEARLRANVIVPGYIETRMVAEDLNPQVREKALRAIPLRRFGTVEEVADAAVFLAANQYANNCVLNLDGGLSAV